MALVSFGIALMTAFIQAESARAGTYEMWNCSAPGHVNSLLHPWVAGEWLVPNVSLVDACATGGGWGVNVSGSREIAGGYGTSLTLSRPTGPRRQIEFVRFTVWYDARLSGSGQPMSLLWGNYRADGNHLTPVVPAEFGDAMAEFNLNPDTEHAQLAFRCGVAGVVSVTNPCVTAYSVPLLIHGLKVTLKEDVPPIVFGHGGTLLEGGTQNGVRTVSYAASDPLSGLNRVDVVLGDTVVATEDLTPRCSYSDFTVCPAYSEGTVQVDTRRVATGRYPLTIRVWDAAGNLTEVRSDSLVYVANDPLPTQADASPYTLTTRFAGASRSTLTVPYGRRVVVRGRLTRTGHPVAAGTSIEVLERLDRKGTRETAAGRVKTKADGSFSVVVPTTRPSRVVRLAYRAADGSQVASRTLKLRVRAASRIRASLRGRLVRFSGRVLSGPIAKRGKHVRMEGRAPGSAWTAFKSLRTDRDGRFSGTYRLRVRRPGVLLKIRAVVPSETGYGYAGSRSRAVMLRVR